MLLIGSQLGDRFDAAHVQSLGLILMAIVYFVLGASVPIFGLSGLTAEIVLCALWAMNGVIQSVGWPTGVKLICYLIYRIYHNTFSTTKSDEPHEIRLVHSLCISLPFRLMANWFDGSHDGMIFGLWTSCQCTGNIMGAAYCNIVDDHNLDLQWNFWIPAAQALAMGVLIFMFVPTYPKGIRPVSTRSNQQHVHEEYHRNGDYDANRGIIRYPEEASVASVSGKEGVGLVEALMLPNVLMYGLIFACIKGVNYTLFFWVKFNTPFQ